MLRKWSLKRSNTFSKKLEAWMRSERSSSTPAVRLDELFSVNANKASRDEEMHVAIKDSANFSDELSEEHYVQMV